MIANNKIYIQPAALDRPNLSFVPGALCKRVTKVLRGQDNIKVLCIGTDRATGDCFGPLVGTYLSSTKSKYGFEIFGSLMEPVTALTVEDVWREIKNTGTTIAVDASLSNVNVVNNVTFRMGPMKPGSAMQKDLGEVGHIAIAACVNVSGYFEHMVLQNTRLYTVDTMARYVASELDLAARRLKHLKRGIDN